MKGAQKTQHTFAVLIESHIVHGCSPSNVFFTPESSEPSVSGYTERQGHTIGRLSRAQDLEFFEALGCRAAEFEFDGGVAEFEFEAGAEGLPGVQEIEAHQGGAVELREP